MNAPAHRHITGPFQIVRDFEDALCVYTGAPYAVTVTSCTMALLLAVAWHLRSRPVSATEVLTSSGHHAMAWDASRTVEIPKRTYVGVPMSIIHAGGWPIFRDEQWEGAYRLKPYPIWDAARLFTSGMFYRIGSGPMRMVCVSFHWSKTLGIQQGGAILHNDPDADAWLRRARFDGRTEGVPPREDAFAHLGWHCYMAPETAAQGLMRLALLPQHNEPLPWDEYPDLSQLDIFKGGEQWAKQASSIAAT